MTKLTTYTENGRTFIISKDERGYWGIEDKYIDAEGRTKKQLNGMNGNLSDTMKGCLMKVHHLIQLEKMIAEGMNPVDAAVMLAQA